MKILFHFFLSVVALVGLIAGCTGSELGIGDTTKVEAILGVKLGTVVPFLRDKNSVEVDQRFIHDQCRLIKSLFVVKAALARRDIAQLDLVKAQSDKAAWLLNSLDVQNPVGTSLIVLTLSSRGNAKELCQVLDSVVTAYQNDVVVLERIADFEQLKEVEINAKQQETDLGSLLERQQALADSLKDGTPRPVELQMLDLNIKVRRQILEDLHRAIVIQKMRDTLVNQEVKILQLAMEVPTE